LHNALVSVLLSGGRRDFSQAGQATRV